MMRGGEVVVRIADRGLVAEQSSFEPRELGGTLLVIQEWEASQLSSLLNEYV